MSSTPPVRAVPALMLAAAVFAAAGVPPATAQSRLMASNLPADLGPAGRDWLSVGRLDTGGGGFCTVTLIAPDRALTAAHCLADAATGAPRPLASLRVRLGLRNGRAEVERGVRAVRLAWGQAPGAAAERGVAGDLGLILLDSPVRLPQVPPLAAAPQRLRPGETLTVVSYARGRSEQAAVQEDCRVTHLRADGVLALDCMVDHGASGAPVIARRPGAPPRVVAVISARAQFRGEGAHRPDMALAAPLHDPAAQPLLTAGQAAPAEGPRVRRPEAPGAGTASGARFVRP